MSTTTVQPNLTPTSDQPTLLISSPNLMQELYRITAEEYEQLVRTVVLNNSNIELIQGLLVKKIGKNPSHVFVTARLMAMLASLSPTGWHRRQEAPVRLLTFDEPETDIAVTARVLEDYLQRHPTPTDLALVVEVSESTLDRDQNEKQSVYASAEIPVYRVVNLIERQVEQYTDPKKDRYQSRQVYRGGSHVPLTIASAHVGQIPLDDVLPPSR